MSNIIQMVQDLQKDKSAAGRFSRHAANKEIKFREECEFALEIVKNSSQLQKCTQESVMASIMEVATLGLSLSKTNSYAYLTPRKNKRWIDNREQYVWECVLVPGYRGLLKLGTDGGGISHVVADVVYEKDFIQYEQGTSPTLIHRPHIFGDRGRKIGSYCVTTLANGEKQVTFMTAEEIEAVKAKSDNTESAYSPWKWMEGEMWKKCPIRRAYKTWPRSVVTPQIERAIDLLNQHEGIIEHRVNEKPMVETIGEEQVRLLELVPVDFEIPVAPALNKVLQAYGVQTLAALPADRFSEAKQRLEKLCEAQRQKLTEKGVAQ